MAERTIRIVRMAFSTYSRGTSECPYKPPPGYSACKTSLVLRTSKTCGLCTLYGTHVQFRNLSALTVAPNQFIPISEQWRQLEEDHIHVKGNEQAGRIPQHPESQTTDTDRHWSEYCADPSEWWDNRGRKNYPGEADFKHKGTNWGLWIDSYKKPPCVDGELDAAGASFKKVEIEDKEKRGKDYFPSANHWWEIRGRKIHHTGKALMRKSTNDGLCIDSYRKRVWVDGQLKSAATELCKSGTPTMPNSLERCEDIRSLCKVGKLKEALQILKQGSILADSKTYVCLLQECTKMKCLAEGKQVHAHIIQSGFKPDIFLHNSLVNMHAKCGSIVDARLVFNEMSERGLATWNLMMAGYAKKGHCRDVVNTYTQMMQEGVTPNQTTFIFVLKACANLADLGKGKDIHAHIVKTGIVPNIILDTTLVNMYAKCGSINDAKGVFHNMPERDVVSWGAMIAGYTQHGFGMQALETYKQMKREGVKPDQVTFVSVCNACASLAAQEKGKEVHVDILKAGIVPNVILGTTLVDMYAKCGSINDAKAVFENMTERNAVSWNAMISGYAQHGCGIEALETYEQMKREGVKPDQATFVSVCNACARLAALEKGKEVHDDIVRAGIVPNIILDTTLVDMYAKCGSVNNAKRVFDNMRRRDVVSWGAMIAAYAQHGCGVEALEIYEQMMQEGVTPNQVTYVCLCNACASLAALEKGKVVHVDIQNAGIVPNIVLDTTLVDMYAKCGSINDAKRVFDNMIERNVVSWGAMIAGYVQHGFGVEALETYKQMVQEGVKPDHVTFISICNACANLAALEKAKEVHGEIIKAGIVPDIILGTTLVDMYAKCGSINDAKDVFDNMEERNAVSWNAMLAGYAQHGCGIQALEAYEQMMWEGVKPDQVTFICVANACASLAALDKGKEVHSDIMQAGIVPNIVLNNTLVDMYAKCRSIEDAKGVFDTMAERNVVSWNAMIAGYAQHGFGMEALNTYEQMVREGMKPDQVTFVCVCNACANLAALEKGKEVHADIMKAAIVPNVILDNTLIDMYAKCGSIMDAKGVFDSMAEWNVVSWNAMIAGYAQHACCRVSLQLFERMQKEGLKPDSVTFVCVLSACSHGGLVDEGKHYFDSLSQEHGLTPTAEHFGCLVDLLGRAGRLDEAEDFVDKMPIKPDVVVFKALLGACRIHGNVEVAERVAKFILQQDRQDVAT